MRTLYKIVWSSGDDDGELPIIYTTMDEAVVAAREWAEEMERDTVQNTPQAYRWEVVRVQPPIPPQPGL